MSGNNFIGLLKGSVQSLPTLSGTVSVAVTAVPSDQEPYTGEYEVTPDISGEQVLATANKYLAKDIVINPVPYSETTNASDGVTVYIGKEV